MEAGYGCRKGNRGVKAGGGVISSFSAATLGSMLRVVGARPGKLTSVVMSGRNTLSTVSKFDPTPAFALIVTVSPCGYLQPKELTLRQSGECSCRGAKSSSVNVDGGRQHRLGAVLKAGFIIETVIYIFSKCYRLHEG